MALSTDFQDDVLNTSANTKRKYQMTENNDGTVSFDDVTSYSQTGSDYGAKEIIEEREAINQMGNIQICYRKFEEVSQSSVSTDTEVTKTISWTMDDEEVEKFTTDNQGERQIWLVPVGLAYCTILGFPTFSISGTTVTMSIRLHNVTNITHTLTARVMILAVRIISD